MLSKRLPRFRTGSGGGLSVPRSRAASVAIITAILLPVMIGIAALVTEYGSALLVRSKCQRIADLSAYAGAMAYGSVGSSGISAAVDRVANLNGVASSDVTESLLNSPTGDGQKAVYVTVQGTVPLILAHVLTSATGISPSASAYAELKASSPACIVALSSSGNGVSASGGTSLTADGCAVGSNASISVTGGASIVTPEVTYDSAQEPDLSNVSAPAGKTLVVKKAVTQDPVKNNSSVSAETAQLAELASMTAPSAPNVPSGSSVTFGWSASTTTSEMPSGCQATFSSSNDTWTVTCSGNGPFYFGTISLGGGISLNFNTNGSSNAVYDFSGDIDGSSGAAMSFGPGTYNVAGGIVSSGGMTMSFGAGTFNVGVLSASCQGGTGYSICEDGNSIVIAGPSTFSLAGGIYVRGGGLLALGTTTIGNTSPTGNSFNIGAAADGNSLNIGGSADATLADATGAGDIFQATGNIVSSGGSCMVLSAASQHDIGGYMSLSGGLYVGAGVYSVGGYVGLGVSGGGDVRCTVNGVSQELGLAGTDVSFGILGNTTLPSSNACPTGGDAFCVGAGYSSVVITAPATGAMADVLVVGPTSSSNNAAVDFSGGSSGTQLDGLFYFPNGSISLSGAASVGSGPGQCLELIGSQVNLSGGSSFASACSGMGGTSGATALLVQ